MNDPKAGIRDIIRTLAKSTAMTVSNIVGTVVSGTVNGSICDVQPVDGALIKNVRLNANTQNYAGFRVTPVDGSYVIVTMISENDAYISLFSDIDKIEVADDHDMTVSIEDGVVSVKDQKGLNITIDNGKLTIRNNQAAFWEQMNNLLKALQQAVIATPSGTGAFAGNTIQQIIQVQQMLAKLLE